MRFPALPLTSGIISGKAGQLPEPVSFSVKQRESPRKQSEAFHEIG